MGHVLLEALVVVALGLLLALAGNAVSDHGLQWGRDYFLEGLAATPDPGAPRPAAPPAATAVGSSAAAAAGPQRAAGGSPSQAPSDDGIDAAVAGRLAEKGLTALGHEAAVALWRDPMYQEYEATLFLDARRAEDYAEGHIPGAWHFDPFYPEQQIDTLLPMLSTAVTVVVYCAGGQCDDSESAALLLLNLGAIDAGRLRIYSGGMKSWRAARLPLEVGARGSLGQLEPETVDDEG